MSILSWRYGVRPRLMVDTLGVTRALLGHQLRSLKLGNVAEHLKLGVKGNELVNVIGMGRDAIKQAGMWQRFCDYAVQDAELCAGIYDKLVRSGLFPVREIAVMDMVLRCATEPRLCWIRPPSRSIWLRCGGGVDRHGGTPRSGCPGVRIVSKIGPDLQGRDP